MAGVTQAPSISASGAPVAAENSVKAAEAASMGGTDTPGIDPSLSTGYSDAPGFGPPGSAPPPGAEGPTPLSGAQGGNSLAEANDANRFTGVNNVDQAALTKSVMQGGPVGGPGGIAGMFSNSGISPLAAGIQAGGQAIGGLGQGMMQKQAMQEQINAEMAPFNSWQNKGTGVISAAGGPTTVSSGYLARAAALRNMLNGTPSGRMAQTPTTPPPVMGAPGGGPVPVLGMNSTPRGGMPGG
jgi:hypothetical protein